MGTLITSGFVEAVKAEGNEMPINRVVARFSDLLQGINNAPTISHAEFELLHYQAVDALAGEMGLGAVLRTGEPYFVLNGSDPCAPGTVRRYGELAEDMNTLSPQQLRTVEQIRQNMLAWRRIVASRMT